MVRLQAAAAAARAALPALRAILPAQPAARDVQDDEGRAQHSPCFALELETVLSLSLLPPLQALDLARAAQGPDVLLGAGQAAGPTLRQQASLSCTESSLTQESPGAAGNAETPKTCNISRRLQLRCTEVQAPGAALAGESKVSAALLSGSCRGSGPQVHTQHVHFCRLSNTGSDAEDSLGFGPGHTQLWCVLRLKGAMQLDP